MKDMTFERPCVFCGKVHSVDVMEYEFRLWREGTLIQEAMPDTSVEDREFLISGICPKCQEDIFGVDDDDLEDIPEIDDDFDFSEFEPFEDDDDDLPF